MRVHSNASGRSRRLVLGMTLAVAVAATLAACSSSNSTTPPATTTPAATTPATSAPASTTPPAAGALSGTWSPAKGDLDGASAAMREALAHHESLEMPFERGHTLLAYGQILRRRKERKQARAMLDEALSVFQAFGAPIWADRARAELQRLPVRRAPAGLTATEEQVARLAAIGLTNLQIADRAFISSKTVEANLSRVYAPRPVP